MAQLKFDNNVWVLSNNWGIEDVRVVIACRGVEDTFSDNDCVKVLQAVVRAFDSSIGINWDTIGAAIDIVSEQRGDLCI